MLTQALVYDLISVQATDDLSPILPIGSEDGQIGILDIFALQGDDLIVNLKQPPKYRVRTWFGVDWWYKGTGWLDKIIDVTVGAVKPLVVPVAQINAIKNYTGRTMADFINDDDLFNLLLIYGRFGDNHVELLTRIYEYYTVICPQEMTPEIYDAISARDTKLEANIVQKTYDEVKYIQNPDQSAVDAWLLANNENMVITHNFGTEEEPIYKSLSSIATDIEAIKALDDESINELILIKDLWVNLAPRQLTREMYDLLTAKNVKIDKSYEEITLVPNADMATYSDWVRQKHNDIIYETIWKLNKYNATDKDGNSVYAKYLNKFVSISESGERHLKATAPILCMIFYISVVLAIIFVIKYPIALAQGRWEGRRRRREIGEE